MKIKVLKSDIKKAIKTRIEVYKTSDDFLFRSMTSYCPIAQALTRNGFSFKAVEYDYILLNNNRKLYLDDTGKKITIKTSIMWDQLLKLTPIEVELTDRTPKNLL